MNRRYGMVYMGSKEQILHLIRYIFEREYKKRYFIDLFCGGFSVSNFALVNSNYIVFANDINKYLIALIKAILNENSDLKTVKFNWVSREHFEEVRDNPGKYPDWYVGLVLNVWSFGINQRHYLYGSDRDFYKKALHNALVFDDFSEIKKLKELEDFTVPEIIRNVDYKRHYTKRTTFMQKFKKYAKEHEKEYPVLKLLDQMQHLQQMEHLDAIKRAIPHQNRLNLSAMDWLDFYNSLPDVILKEAFIYCDPPYENKAQYQFGGEFDYEKFWQWFRTCPYSVYVSSYEAPEDIKPINFDYKIQLLNNGDLGDNKPKKKAVENIYWNNKGDAEPTFLDQLFSEIKKEGN